jgi:hypothetical protein
VLFLYTSPTHKNLLALKDSNRLQTLSKQKTASGFNLQKSTTPLYLPASQTDNQNQLLQSFTIKNIDHLLFSPKTKAGVQVLNKPGYSNKKDSK